MKEMKVIINLDYDQLVERQQKRKKDLKDLMIKNRTNNNDSIITDDL